MTLPFIDYNQKPEELEIYLCKPDHTVIQLLPYLPQQSFKLNELGEITFEIPYEIEKDGKLIRNPHIDMIKSKYRLKVIKGNDENWYLLESPKQNKENNKDTMTVTAKSLPYELSHYLIRVFNAESVNAQDALLDVLRETNWNIGYIDSSFLLKFRSFDIQNTTVLNAVIQIAESFDALIIWDENNYTINLYQPKNIGQDRGLFVDYGKYLDTLNQEFDEDNFCTRLYVKGKDNLTIHEVTPTGQDYIEDFSYFMYPFERDENKQVIKHSNYMTDELCNAILDYNEFVYQKDGQFKTLLGQIETIDKTITQKKNELRELNDQLTIVEDNIDVYNSTSRPGVEELIAQKENLLSQIESKESEIFMYTGNYNQKMAQIQQLKSELQLEKHFSPQLLKERNQYVIEKEWIADYHIDPYELYEDAKRKFQEYATPPMIIKIDIANFTNVLTEQFSWDKLVLGDYITIIYDKFGIDIKARLNEIVYNYQDNNISIVISNIQRNENEEQKLTRLLYQSIGTSTVLEGNKHKWDQIDNTTTMVNEILTQKWDATTREIEAGINNSVSITRRGITITNPDNPLHYLIAQNGVLAITNDGGNTWKNAITSTGIIAERLYGQILIGSNLYMENSSGTFRFDEEGVTLESASLTITGGLTESHLALPSSVRITNEGLYAERTDGLESFKIKTDGNTFLKLIDPENSDRRIVLDTEGIRFTQDGEQTWQNGFTYDGLFIGSDLEDAITQITNNTISTTNVFAENLTVSFANVLGTIVADMVDANWVYGGLIQGDQIQGGTITGVEINIGNNNFVVDESGWIKGAKGNFSVPPNADGVYNNYGGAARWKYSDAHYLYQDSGVFSVYLSGQKFRVLADGSAWVYENGAFEQIASRSWVEANNIARFG